MLGRQSPTGPPDALRHDRLHLLDLGPDNGVGLDDSRRNDSSLNEQAAAVLAEVGATRAPTVRSGRVLVLSSSRHLSP